MMRSTSSGATPRHLEGVAGRGGGEGGEGLVTADDVALADAGAGLDPLVVGLDQRREVVVGEELLGGRPMPTPAIWPRRG